MNNMSTSSMDNNADNEPDNNADINNDHILVDDNTNIKKENYQSLEDKIVAMGN